MATTVLASSATGTSSNATVGTVPSGYSLLGFATSTSTNTANYATIDVLKTSNTTAVYQINKKDEAENATFYYSSSSKGAKTSTTASGTKTTYLMCTSTTVAETSVSHGNCTVPTTLSGEVVPYETTSIGWATANNTMSASASPTCTTGNSYYKVYQTNNVTLYYPSSTSAVTSSNLYRNAFYGTDTAYTVVLATDNTGTSDFSYPTVSPYTGLRGFASSPNTTSTAYSSITAAAKSNATTLYEMLRETRTGTFYYNSSTAGDGTVTIATATANGYRYLICQDTSTAKIANGNYTVPSAVTASKGPYGGDYVATARTANSMSSSTTVAYDTFYAYYRSEVANNYYSSDEYTTRTLYRNSVFTSTSAMKTVLSTSTTGTSNYTTAAGPGSSSWAGLSTEADTTAEYSTVALAATSTSGTLYTVYQFNITYSKGSNVSEIGVTSGNCKVSATGESTGGTSCTVTLPTITANTGYTSVGWNTTSGATDGTAAGESYTLNSNPTTLYANATANTYTATFYYQSNTTSGSTTVTSTTATCTVSNTDGNCTATIPTAVKNSGGTYNNTYYGLSESTGNMTTAVNSSATTVTISGNKSYYALYSSAVTINYPSSISAKDSATAYRNQWLTSNSAMATTVLATTTTGTSSNYSFTSSVSGYSLYGFATEAGTNTRAYNDVAALKTSNATTVYAILYKSVTATFKYSSDTSGTVTSSTASANQYVRCTSTAAEVNNSSISPATTGEVAPDGTASVGWATAVTNMSTVSPTTANTTYYKVYRQALTIYYPTSTSNVSSVNNKIYRIAVITSSTGTTYTRRIVSGTTGTTQLANSGVTTTILASMYGTFNGLATTYNTTTKNNIDNTNIINSSTTTYYALTTNSETVSFVYNSNTTSGGFTKTTDTSVTATSTYYCSSTSAVGVSHGATTTVPTAVSNSVGKYNSAYKGISSSSTGITNVTSFAGGTTYYAYYSSALAIYYPTSVSAIGSSNTLMYRNEYFSSTTAMSAVIASSQTTSTAISSLTISGIYGTFKGLTDTVNSSSYTAIGSVSSTYKDSANKTFYAVSTNSEDVTFHYNSNATCGSFTDGTDTASVTSTYYCSSTSAVGVTHGTTTTVPTAASNSKGKYNSSYKGISSSSTGITNATTFTGGRIYYAYYSSALTITYLSSATATSSSSTLLYRNEYYSSSTAMTTITATSQTSTTQATSITISGLYGTFAGLATSNSSTTTYAVNNANVVSPSACTTTYYAVSTYSVTYTKGSNVSTIGSTSGSCKATTSAKKCNVTLPTITANTGYTSVGWSTTSGATTGTAAGASYELTSTGQTLYANAVGNIYSITLNNQSATTAGTQTVYYQYYTSQVIGGVTCYYYNDAALTNCLTGGGTIEKPTKDGYTFGGYYSETNGGGTQYVQSSGAFVNRIFEKLPSEINSSYTDNIILYAKWTGNTYTATFYYQSNTTSGSTTVTSTTATCTVSNTDGNCTATIPTAVKNSGGTYNNAYYGLSESTGNMTAAASKTATTVTLTGNKSYYALYSSEVTIYYPSSTSAASNKKVYRNQWLASTSAMATTVLATAATGTSSNATAGTAVSGYSTLVGFATSSSTNTANYATIAALTTSNATTVYQINKKTESITATFYYNENTTPTCNTTSIKTTTASGTRTTFIRCTSTTAAETTVDEGAITVPTVVSDSKGPHNTTYRNVASGTSSMAVATVDTGTTTYYAVYRTGVNVYKPKSTTESEKQQFYRNEYFTSTSAMGIALSTSSTGTSNGTVAVVSGYTFNKLHTAVNSGGTAYTVAGARDTCTTTFYASETKSVTATFYYSPLAVSDYTYSNVTPSTTTASGTQTLHASSTTAAAISHGNITVPSAVTGSNGGASAENYIGVATNENSVTTVTPTTANTTYYAVYTETLTFYYYNGSAHTSKEVTRRMLCNSGKYGNSLSESAPTPSNYDSASYVAWSYDSTQYDSSYQRTPLNTGVNSLYAVYSKSVTATFYYNENATPTCNTTSIKTTTSSGTRYYVSKSGGINTYNGSITVPTAVSGSRGQYNGTYVNVASAVSSVTAATVDTGTTTYYAFYRTSVKIYYPSSASAATYYTVYRNEWFSSTTAMTRALSTSTTGKSTNVVGKLAVSGYDTLVGWSTSASTNTATYTTAAGLRDSCTATVYEIDKKTESENATFYYSNSATGEKANTTASGTKTTYLRCTSTSAAGTSVSHGSCTVPTSLSGETAPYGTTSIGWATANNTMSASASPTCTTGNSYYKVYRTNSIKIYYPSSETAVANITTYRNAFYGTGTAYSVVLATTNTGTSSFTATLVEPYTTLRGFRTTANSATREYSTIAAIAKTDITTFYQIDNYSVEGTFYYNSSTAGNGTVTVSTATATALRYLYCETTTAAKKGNGSYTVPDAVTGSVGPYGQAYVATAGAVNSMTASKSAAYTKLYAFYQGSVTNYYYTGSAYASRTLYRNSVFTSDTAMKTVLSTSDTGTSNYSTAVGPGSSAWAGLSTGADTTAEYSTVALAATSTSATLYTVYQFNVTYSKGANVSAIGATSGSCKIYSRTSGTTPTSCTVTLPTITANTGYTSVGWNTTSGATTGTAAGQSYTLSSNPLTLYANAKAKTYTVIFDCNGGTKPSGKLGNMTATYGQTFTMPSDLCTRTGYTQTTNSEWKDPTNVVWKKGWSGTWTYDNGQFGITNDTLTLTAQWTANTYTVIFDCNGGTKPSGTLGNMTATYDQTFTMPNDLCTRDGYTQTTNGEWKDPTNVVWKKGWSGTWTYDNGQFGITNNSLTLKAQWTGKTYTLKYWNGNGVATAGSTQLGTDQTCTFGTACTLQTYANLGGVFPYSSAASTNYGWSFYGWTTQTGTTRQWTDGGTINPTTYSATVNIFSLGSKNYRFNSGNAPTASPTSQYQYWNPRSTAASYRTSITVPSATAISGWTFLGYIGGTNSAANGTVDFAASTVGTYNPIIETGSTGMMRAKYSRTLTISYDANGGSGTTDNTTLTQYYNSGYGTGSANTGSTLGANTIALAQNNFTRTNYNFSKWAEGSANGTQYPAGAGYYGIGTSITGATVSKTMYAIWERVELWRWSLSCSCLTGNVVTVSSSPIYPTESMALSACESNGQSMCNSQCTSQGYGRMLAAGTCGATRVS